MDDAARQGHGILFWCATIFVLLLVLYPLSLSPINRLLYELDYPESVTTVLAFVYEPIWYAVYKWATLAPGLVRGIRFVLVRRHRHPRQFLITPGKRVMDDKSKGHGWFLWSLVTVFSLVVLYALSLSPIRRLLHELRYPERPTLVMRSFYRPLVYTVEDGPRWLADLFHAYDSWWFADVRRGGII